MSFRTWNLYGNLHAMAPTAIQHLFSTTRSAFGGALCVLAFWCFGAQLAMAGCDIVGPQYKLTSDTVDWLMTIGTGQNCIQGLRLRTATLDVVIIASPAQHGELAIRGSGFEYRANPQFTGQDSFEIMVTGTNKRIPGRSTIRVDVSVR